MVTEEQFLRLFVKHESELRGFATSLLLSSAEAEDLVQEACISMWRKIDTLEHEKAYRSWAYSYVRLMALNRRRKQQRSPLVFSDELINCMADEAELETEEAAAEQEALKNCLAQLGGKQKDLIARYYATSKTTVAEVSEQLERPVAGVYKALDRTRKALRRCIEARLRQEETV